MPVGTPCDSGLNEAASSTTAAPRSKKTKDTSKRDAVLKALAAARTSMGVVDEPSADPDAVPLMPAAHLYTGMDTIAGAGSAEGLANLRLDIKKLTRDLMNGFGAAKGNKAVMKAIQEAVNATDADGRPRYAQAAEIISIVAGVASIFEPDDLARFIRKGMELDCAYRPIRHPLVYNMQITAVFDRLKHKDSRRKDLFENGLVVSHSHRWANEMLFTLENEAPNRRKLSKEIREARDKANELRDKMASYHRGTAPDPQVLVEALMADVVECTPQTIAFYRDLQPTDAQRKHLVDLANLRPGNVSRDTHTILAHIYALAPDERPESPFPQMVKALFDILRDPELDEEWLVEKPDTWMELYPNANLKGFPIPAAIRQIEGQTVPGGAGVIVLCRNELMLEANATEMGNCTRSHYGPRCESGQSVIGRVQYNGEIYNFALNRAGNGFTLGEVNSRFNRGQVPNEVRQGLSELARQFTNLGA